MSGGSGTEGGLVRLPFADAAEQAPEETWRLILFQACDEWFALPIAFVREVQPLGPVTRVPTAAREILGVLNVRGRALTLFGLAECLDIPPGDTPRSHAVVLDLGDAELYVGLAVQGIVGVRRVAVSAVEPPPPRGSGPDCLEGVFDVQGRVVGLLDPARVFGRFLTAWGIALQTRGAWESQGA
jgi:purine-binding chemotaxis protein CheW